MGVAVKIPNSLREYCGDYSEIELTSETVLTALDELKRTHAEIFNCVCDETGTVRRHVNLFVNNDLVVVQNANGMQTPLRSGDVLTIWTSVSGG